MAFPYVWLPSKAALLALVLILFTSALISTRIFGYSLVIGRIRPSSIRNIRYSYSDTFISASSIHIAFHIPRPSNPRLATFTAYDYHYEDAGCRVSIAEIRAALWLFPVLFGVTGGPWLSVGLHDFRLRVFTSKRTPLWVRILRKNIITTVLTGELLRLDDFKATVLFSSVNPDAAPAEKVGAVGEESQDEIRVTGYGEAYHTRNWQERLYTIEKVQAQLRKNWEESRGSFVLIAEGIRWTKEPVALRQQTDSFWWKLASSFFYFPSEIFKILRDPLSTVDLYLPRIDITFNKFRIRDAELVKQGGMMLKAHWDASGHVYHALLWDYFIRAVETLGT